MKARAQSVRAYVTAPLRLMWRLIRYVAPQAPEAALHRMVWAFLGLTLSAGFGVAGYVLIDDFSPFDALYQTLLTLTTVGFQEVYPLSRGARIFTVFLMVFGVGIALYLLTAIATLLLEGDLYREVDERRQRRMIDQMSGHTIFVGAGRMGLLVAEELARSGRTLVVIEPEVNAANRAQDRGWNVLTDSAERESVLKAAGIERAQSIYVMTGVDAVNLVITIRARRLSSGLSITTRVNEPENKDLMRDAGASEVLSPGELLAREVMATVARNS